MLNKITLLINRYGPATCQILADRLGYKPCDVIPVLRRGVERQVLSEINGFYRIFEEESSPRRKSHAWVEGRVLSSDVTSLLRTYPGTESVSVVAELDSKGQKKGYAAFVLATLNTAQCTFTSSITGNFITDHVVRYLLLDTRTVRSL
ncbi:hypothetical protein ABRC46_001956 [Salmonella enterica]|nr:hypothetical protein [Salmonella enterica]EGP6830216.1 hypothetical protein [Salmonella enterica]EGS4698228.1 hypothetical protein [Salmonella enterica]EIJ8349260.1 hypothetical protein [Salmonella enterica]EIX3948886.1 hypothetical protein [Salmonella enterica]